MADQDNPNVVTEVHPHAHSVDEHVRIFIENAVYKLLGQGNILVLPEECSKHEWVLKPFRDVEWIGKQAAYIGTYTRVGPCNKIRIWVNEEKGSHDQSIVIVALQLLLPVEAVKHALGIENHGVCHHRKEAVRRFLVGSVSETVEAQTTNQAYCFETEETIWVVLDEYRLREHAQKVEAEEDTCHG